MGLRAPAEIVDAFGQILPAEPPGGHADPSFAVEVSQRSADGDWWQFVLPDNSVVFGPMAPAEVAQSLLTQFTRLTVLTHPQSWFLHAGVVSGPDGAVAVMAPSGTGKSTFVARLLQDHHGYLSDELAWIRPDRWEVVPYPKPISLDERSLALLGQLTAPGPGAGSGIDGEHLLDHGAFGSAPPPSSPEPLALLVKLSRGHPGPVVRPLSDADKVVAILDNQLNLMGRPDPLRDACDLTANVATVAMATDDLDRAAGSLDDAAQQASPIELASLLGVPAPAAEAMATSDAPGSHPSIDPFTALQPVEPLSVATFADGSAVVVGTTSGRYAVTNAGGARLASALGPDRAIIDLASACDVSVPNAEQYYSRLVELDLVGPGGHR